MNKKIVGYAVMICMFVMLVTNPVSASTMATIVNTGDTTNMTLYMVLLAAAVIGLLAMLLLKKKKK